MPFTSLKATTASHGCDHPPHHAGPGVDYGAWVKQRLRQAAAEKLNTGVSFPGQETLAPQALLADPTPIQPTAQPSEVQAVARLSTAGQGLQAKPPQPPLPPQQPQWAAAGPSLPPKGAAHAASKARPAQALRPALQQQQLNLSLRNK